MVSTLLEILDYRNIGITATWSRSYVSTLLEILADGAVGRLRCYIRHISTLLEILGLASLVVVCF